MTRLMQGVAAVVLSVLLGGLLGGVVGREVGVYSPSFVRAIYPAPPDRVPADLDLPEFGMGLGIASGLFFGAGAGALVVVANAAREAWIYRGTMLKEWPAESR
jgi:hypothetical protein